MKRTNKILTALEATSLRILVQNANELGILKEDIVDIYKFSDTYVMLYYYGETK